MKQIKMNNIAVWMILALAFGSLISILGYSPAVANQEALQTDRARFYR